MKINWKTRIKHPAFWIGLIGVIASPILAYNGIAYSDLTSWHGVGEVIMGFVSNPYLIGSVVVAVMSFLGLVTDPTTPGVGDSDLANSYTAPGKTE